MDPIELSRLTSYSFALLLNELFFFSLKLPPLELLQLLHWFLRILASFLSSLGLIQTALTPPSRLGHKC